MSAVTYVDFSQPRQQVEQPEKRMQEGFIAIPNAVDDALLASPLTHRQERVYRAILRKTIGYGKQSDYIATSQLADMTGIDESDARKAVNDLLDMGMIIRGRRTKFGTETTPVLTVESWNFKQGKSPRLPPQTGRITPNKQGKSPPTIDNSKRQTTTPLPPEREVAAATVGEPAKSQPAKQVVPYDAILQAYRDALPELSQPDLLTDHRKKTIAARWKQLMLTKDPMGRVRYSDVGGGVAWWGRLFAKVRKNSHWMGNNERGWAADFDWIMGAKNFVKVLEWRPVEVQA